MKQYIKYLVLSIGITAFMVFVLGESVARQCPNSYRYKNEYMKSNANEIKTLVFGGSRIYYSIKPDILGRGTFSLAQVSQPLAMDEWLFFKWKDDYDSLNTIIIEINNSNVLGGNFEKGSEWYRGIYYTLYMNYKRETFYSKYNFEFANMAGFRNKVQKGIAHLIIGYNHIECDSLGWGTSYKTRSEDDAFDLESNVTAAIGRHNKTDYSNFDRNKSSLERITKYCKANRIRMILISAPVTDEYYSKINKDQIQMVEEVSTYLIGKYNIEYKNYMSDERFSGLDFYDADHLSHQGSIKFSNILKNDFGL